MLSGTLTLAENGRLEATDRIELNLQGDVESLANSLLKTNDLQLTIAGNGTLNTEVIDLNVKSVGAGDVTIANQGDLSNVNSDLSGGNFTLTTTGELSISTIEQNSDRPSQTNSPIGQSISLSAGGDISFDRIDAGQYYGGISLTAGGDIIARNPEDEQIDLQAKTLSFSGQSITNLEVDLSRIDSGVVATGDIRVNNRFEDVLEEHQRSLEIGKLDATTGNIFVNSIGTIQTTTDLTAGAGTIEISSRTDSIRVDVVRDENDNIIDNEISSTVLSLRSSGQLRVDDEARLVADELNLGYGDTGVLQGSVSLPNVVTPDLDLELGSGSIIISPETFRNSVTGEVLDLDSVNLVARGNQVVVRDRLNFREYLDVNSGEAYYLSLAEDKDPNDNEVTVEGRYYKDVRGKLEEADTTGLQLVPAQDFIGRYRYRDVNSGETYYLDEAEPETSRVYEFANGGLQEVEGAARDSLVLAPVLNSISYQKREAQSGFYVYTGNDGREYYKERPDGEATYTRQDSSGQYLYTVFDENQTVPGYRVIASNEADYDVFVANNKALYSEIEINFSRINNAGTLTLEAKLLEELAGGIQLGQASGELAQVEEGFAIDADRLVLSAQRDISNVTDFAELQGSAISISSGGSLHLDGAPQNVTDLSIASTGYFDAQGTFIGGRLTSDVTLKATNLTLSALEGYNVDTDVETLNAKVVNDGDLVINEADGVDLVDVSVNNGNLSLNLAATGTVDLSQVAIAGGNFNITTAADNTINFHNVSATDGNLNVDASQATLGFGFAEFGDTITLNAQQVNSLESDGEADLIGKSLNITVSDSVGRSDALLETTVETVAIAAGNDVNLDNYGGVTVTSVMGFTPGTQANSVNIETHSPLTITGLIDASDSIMLKSGDQIEAGDDLLLTGTAELRGSDITLLAGDNFTAAVGSQIAATGEVLIEADYYSDRGSTEDQDPGVGATIDLSANVTGTKLTILGNDDAETINLNATAVPLTIIDSGLGDDTINLGQPDQTVNRIGGDLELIGNDDIDTLNIDNRGNRAEGTELIVTETTIDGLVGMTGGITYNTIEFVNIWLGDGDKTVSVDDNITAQVTVDAGEGSNNLRLDYSDATNDFDLTLANREISGFESQGSLVFSEFDSIDLRLGSGRDRFTVKDSDFSLDIGIDLGDNDDIIRFELQDLTYQEAVRLTDQNVFGFGLDERFSFNNAERMEIQLGEGADDLTITNQFTGELDAQTGAGDDRVTLIDEATAGTVRIGTEAGADTVEVQKIVTATTIAGGEGDDQINVRNSSQRINEIAATLTVEGEVGENDVLTIDDRANTADNSGTLSENRVTGFGMPGQIDYGTVETVNLLPGSGNDDVTIANTHTGQTNLNTAGGSDTVTIQNTGGSTNVQTGDDVDSVTVENTGAETTVNTEAGDDQVIVEAIAANTTVNTGADNDDIYVRNPENQLDDIGATLTIEGDTGRDRLFLNDSGDSEGNSGSLTDNRLMGLDMAGSIVYSGTERTELQLGSGDDDFTITGSREQSLLINANGGDDSFQIQSTGGELIINGNEGDDVLDANGSTAAVNLGGGAGGDRLAGGSGDDYLRGDSDLSVDLDDDHIGFTTQTNSSASQNDEILGRGGTDLIFGEAGDDVLVGGSESAGQADATDYIFGGSGSDRLAGDNAIIDPATGNVTPLEDGQGAADYLLGDQGTIASTGAPTVDSRIQSGDKVQPTGQLTQINSQLDAAGGNDQLAGGVGNDNLLGGDGADTIAGNGGGDRIFGDHGQLTFVDGQLATAESSETASGAGDLISGNDGDDLIFGGAGQDRITGNAGDDALFGDNGRLLYNQDGDPSTLDEASSTTPDQGDNDIIEGNAGNDIILGGAADDEIRGNAGEDRLFGDNGVLRFVGGLLNRVTSTFANLGGRDRISGNEGDDIIIAGTGDDAEVLGNAGDDILLGDNGEIQLTGGQVSRIESTDVATGGRDRLQGNEGRDILLGGAAGDSLQGNAGDDTLLGDNGGVTLANGAVQSIETIASATGGRDWLQGNAGNDRLLGGADDDSLSGNQGDDVLLGDNGAVRFSGTAVQQITTLDPGIGGDDELLGNEGDDIALGGQGNDRMTGDSGRDVLVGDNGEIRYQNQQVTRIQTTHPTIGGQDSIDGGTEADFILGGAAEDFLSGNDGDDAIAGDSGQINFEVGTVGTGSGLPPVASMVTTDAAVGGDDVILGGAGDDAVLGGAGDDRVQGDGAAAVAAQVEGRAIAQADFDGDGIDDLLVRNDQTGQLGIQFLQADRFADFERHSIRETAALNAPIIRDPHWQLAVTLDMSGNGQNDLVWRNRATGQTVVWTLSEGQVTGATVPSLPQISRDWEIAGVADVNEDGREDLIWRNRNSHATLATLLQNGVATELRSVDITTLEMKTSATATALSESVASLASNAFPNPETAWNQALASELGGQSTDGDDILLGDGGEIRLSGGRVTLIQTVDPTLGGNDQLRGSGGRDVIMGGAFHDSADGGQGDDVVLGDNGVVNLNNGSISQVQTRTADVSGQDELRGGDGNDVILAGDDSDRVEGNAGRDAVVGDNGRAEFVQNQLTVLETLAPENPALDRGGDDDLRGNAGDDVLLGGQGNDRVRGDENRDVLLGDNGRIVYQGSFVRDILTQQPTLGGQDNLDGGDAEDVIFGGAAEDFIFGGDGNDAIAGDQAFATFAFAGDIVAPADTNLATLDFVSVIDPGLGSSDTILGGLDDDTIFGGQDSDRIHGDGFTIETVPPVFQGVPQAQGDLDGDGTEDILLRNPVTGELGIQFVLSQPGQGDRIRQVPLLQAPVIRDPYWKIAAATDVTGEGQSDIIWRNEKTGQTLVWKVSGQQVLSAFVPTMPYMGQNWELLGVSDLNADGQEDWVWRDRNSGEMVGMLMQGGVASDLTSINPATLQLKTPATAAALSQRLQPFAPEAVADTERSWQASIQQENPAGGSDADLILGDQGKRYFNLPRETSYESMHTAAPFGSGDQIFGGQGDDKILGQQGADWINAGSGQDDVIGGHNVVGGADTADTIEGGGQGDVVLGDNGTITRRPAQAGATTAPWQRYPGSDLIIRDVVKFDDIDSLSASNVIRGGDGDDILYGQRGNDLLEGGAGDDELYGDLGDDILRGGPGRDTILGDTGAIVRRYNPDGTPMRDANGFWQRDVILTDIGRVTAIQDVVQGLTAAQIAQAEQLILGGQYDAAGRPVLRADGTWATTLLAISTLPDGNDQIDGGDGDDQIFGQGGNDRITAGSGNNYVEGNGGDDWIQGAAGDDLLVGDDRLSAVPWITQVPSVSRGTILIDQVSGSPLQLNPDSAITTNLRLTANPSQEILPTLSLTPTLQAPETLVTSEASIAMLNGQEFRALMQIIPGLSGRSQHLAGNDTLLGGAGQDTLIGDEITSVMPIRTGNPAVDDQWQELSRELNQLVYDLHDLEIGWHHLTQPQRKTLTLGQDQLEGNGDNDLIIGDNALVLGPLDVSATADDAQLARYLAELRNLTGQLDQQVLRALDTVPQFNQPGYLPDVLAQGNDAIAGGLGDDQLMGDDALFLSPFLDTSNYVPGSFWDYSFSQQRRDTSRSLRSWDQVRNNDSLNGNQGNDLVIGDHTTVLLPLVTPNAATSRNLELLRNDVETFLRDVYEDDYGIPHGQRDQSHTLSVGNDQISGEWGEDLLIGDNATLTLPWLKDGDRSRAFLDLVLRDGYLDVDSQAHNAFHGPLKQHELAYRDLAIATATAIANDKIYGGDGNDIILGLGGDDQLFGQLGTDALFGGDDNDSAIDAGGEPGDINRKGQPSNRDERMINAVVQQRLAQLLNPALKRHLLELSQYDP